jgi:hypothetical protein
MNGSVQRLVRDVVRATHKIPGLKHAYRAIYARAAESAGRLCDANPRVAGVYARNSYALGNFIPGQSDIDLTIVWRDASASGVQDFYTRYAALQARFPMLGEVEMLESRHLTAWTSRAVPGLESSRWMRLGGSLAVQSSYAGNERLDRLRHATSIYRYNLSPLFGTPDGHGIKRRFSAKLFRQLGEEMPRTANDAELMKACMQALSAGARAIAHHPGDPLDYSRLLGEFGETRRKNASPPSAARRMTSRDTSSRIIRWTPTPCG